MNVLLISANTATSPYPVYPLGLAMVAAAARNAGHRVTCYDCLQHGGASEALAQVLRRLRPDIVGVSLRNVDNVNLLREERYVDTVKAVVRCVRAETDAYVVLGGTGFSILPEAILRYVDADCGIVGEGERLFVELLDGAATGRALPARGTILRSATRLPGTAVPAAPYEPDLLRSYLTKGSVATIQTKRGCPLPCVYCSYPSLEGSTIRPRPAAAVLADIDVLVREHNVSNVFFADAVFNDDQGEYLGLLRAMRDHPVKIAWSAFLKPSGLTAETVALMKATGLREAELGSDAASDRALQGQLKPFRFRDVVAANDLLMEQDVKVAHYFMFGGPGETRESVLEGTANIRRLRCTAVFVFMGIRVLPGTGLATIARRQGVIAADRDLLESVYYLSPELDRAWLEATLRDAFRELHHVVFPPDALDDKLQLLHRLGYAGALWDLLGG